MSHLNVGPHLERLRLLYPVRWRIAAGLLCMALTVGAQLAFPQAIAYFIDNVTELTRRGVTPGMVAAMLAFSLLYALITTARFYLLQSGGHMIVMGVRRRLFDVVINQPIAFFDKHHGGELNSRLTSDVSALHESLTIGAANALRSLCVFVGGIAMLLHLSPMLSLPLALFIPISLYLGKLSGSNYRLRARAISASLAASGKVAQEYFAHARLVQAFNQQGGAMARYAQAMRQLLDVSLAGTRLLAVFQGAQGLLAFVALLTTLCFGAHLIGQGRLSVGELTAFVIYASMVTDTAGSISEFWNTWMRTMGSTDRIFEILRSHRAVPEAPPQPPLAGHIALRDVRFSYPERAQVMALDGVSLSIRAGEKIALVGASGAGKSTIASLVLGHYRLDGGSLQFDGIDAHVLGVTQLRRQMAVVEQEPALFSGSIADNIGFAVPDRQVTRDEMLAAARLAHAHDFIAAFPDGYETLVGERGVQLSGGQKQRIAIARAILRAPKILILDEATSALDAASEQQVQLALDTLMQGRTTIIIAHRFSTIVKADRIIVMDKGRICQQGTHAELLRAGGQYARLMQQQLSQFQQLHDSTATL
ncbi:ABC transporter transmembrane domain-containing protein [Janthinobacterium sp. SUN100]|uniref:ABC transporter ATP-binding protein n=1 Tax=Janthinobacterium sp. SUN100 TaxID=3004101 RepID=UPI0025B260CC|nr:ABC transporter transmembrane domain-containing protein [Janthinobacterium sp. SUN100]MDN2700880.1 ABC transporter transmembrane domain-containing protein [Janthinobacterium sp. SUN100]